MAETAWDAVCSRKEQSSNSSYHKGFSLFMISRNFTGPISIYPYILDSRRLVSPESEQKDAHDNGELRGHF